MIKLPAILLAASVVAGCGSERGHLTARYSSRSVDESGTSVERGAFDWTARRGWVIETSDGKRISEFRQLGEDCYERYGHGPWEHTHPEAGLDGFCTNGLPHPKASWRLLRSVSSKWERVGTATIDGAETTHYRSRVDIGGLRGDGDWWIDRPSFRRTSAVLSGKRAPR